MDGFKNMSPSETTLEGSVTLGSFSISHHRNIKFIGYAWDRLPEGSLIVDVGGGVGSHSLTLANHHPHLRFVVQDREPVIRDAVKVCAFLVYQAPQSMICTDN